MLWIDVCVFFCKLLLLWFHRANNVCSMLVLFATFFCGCSAVFPMNHNYSDSYPEFILWFKCFWLFYIIRFCFISFFKDFCSFSFFWCMYNKRIPIFFYFTFLFNDNHDQVKNDLKDFCPLLTTFETTKLSLLKICMFQFIICMLKM